MPDASIPDVRVPTPDAIVEACDVLVIGGGPAGSTAAALLAEAGRDVVLLEKEAHPRFHIGESLLPRNMAIFERLGVRAAVEAIGVRKPGAEFVSDATGRSVAFPFTLAPDKRYPYSVQVPRAEFDAALFAAARRKGARAADRVRVTEIHLARHGGPARVLAVAEDGAARVFAPRFVLDASGRDTFMAGRLRLKEADKRNATAAVFGHFRGVERRGGALEGYITVHLAENGWFWMIPLPGEVMSVGFVGNQAAFKDRRGSMAALFHDRLRQSPTVSARMRGAEPVSEIIATGNYSYRARTAWGDGYLMIGDAFAFIDPIFSSGVLLAMTSGELGAEVAAIWLDDPARGAVLARRAERRLRQAMDRLGWLIYRIHSPVLRHMFMSPQNQLGMRDGLVAMLAGNLDPDWRAALPVAAFKSVYYTLSLARRLGLELKPPEPPLEPPLAGALAGE